MKKAIFAIGLILSATGFHAGSYVHAHGAKAHVHGNAEMQVVVDGKQLVIDLQSPLDSLVGFEHAPRTEKQKQAIKAMDERFAAPATLFVPTPEAKCTAEPGILNLPFSADGAANKGKQDKDVHSELEATIRFQCEQPAELKGMEVRLFDAFTRMHRLEVQAVSPRGQSAARLTPKQRKLQW